MLVFLVHDDEAERFDGRKNRERAPITSGPQPWRILVPFIVAFAGDNGCAGPHERLEFAELNRALNRSTVWAC